MYAIWTLLTREDTLSTSQHYTKPLGLGCNLCGKISISKMTKDYVSGTGAKWGLKKALQSCDISCTSEIRTSSSHLLSPRLPSLSSAGSTEEVCLTDLYHLITTHTHSQLCPPSCRSLTQQGNSLRQLLQPLTSRQLGCLTRAHLLRVHLPLFPTALPAGRRAARNQEILHWRHTRLHGVASGSQHPPPCPCPVGPAPPRRAAWS